MKKYDEIYDEIYVFFFFPFWHFYDFLFFFNDF